MRILAAARAAAARVPPAQAQRDGGMAMRRRIGIGGHLDGVPEQEAAHQQRQGQPFAIARRAERGAQEGERRRVRRDRTLDVPLLVELARAPGNLVLVPASYCTLKAISRLMRLPIISPAGRGTRFRVLGMAAAGLTIGRRRIGSTGRENYCAAAQAKARWHRGQSNYLRIASLGAEPVACVRVAKVTCCRAPFPAPPQ